MTVVISRFKIIYFFFYFTIAIFAGFTIPYLKHFNYTNTQIGFMMSLLYFSGVVGQSFSGYICDLKRTIKKVFFVWMILLSILVFFIFKLENPITIALFLAMIGFLQSPVLTLLDSWVLESDTIIKKNFGPIRAFGSIGWGVSTLIIGKLIDNFGWNIIGYSYVIFASILLIISIKPNDAKKIHDMYSISLKSFKLLSKNKSYIKLITIFFLLYFSFHSVGMFSVILIDDFGGTKGHIGLFLLIAAFSEVPLLLGVKKLIAKVNPTLLLIISSVFFFIRTFLTILSNSVLAIILLSVLQMFSFGILIFISRYLIDKVSPENLKTSSQTIATAVSGGLSAIISYNLCGYLADSIGTKNMLLFVSFLCIIALLLSIKYHRQNKIDV